MMIEIEEIRILVIEDEKPIADILEYDFIEYLQELSSKLD